MSGIQVVPCQVMVDDEGAQGDEGAMVGEGVQGDIAAIIAGVDMTAGEKRQAVYDLKGAALVDATATLVGVPFTVGDVTVTVTRPPIYDSASGRTTVWVSATRDGQLLDLDLPFVYVNPPILVRVDDPHRVAVVGGVRVPFSGVVEDVLGAAKQMITETVSRF